jgi:hypothetical protein
MGGPRPAHNVHLTPCRPALAIWPPATPPLHFRVKFPLRLAAQLAQAAVQDPSLVRGLICIDASLRLISNRKATPLQRAGVEAVEFLLHETPAGAPPSKGVRLASVYAAAAVGSWPQMGSVRLACPPKDAASAAEGSTPWSPPWAPHSARDCHCRRCRCRLHRHRRLVLAVAGPPEHRTPGAGVGLRRPQGRGPGAGGPGVPASAAGARKREHGWAWWASQHFRFPVAKRSAARRPGLASTTQLEQATS